MKLRFSLAISAAALLLSASAAFAQTAPPTVTGLSDDFTPHRVKTWTWSATPSTGVTYRYKIDKIAHYDAWPSDRDDDRDHDDDEAFGTRTHASKHGGNGTYYIHVQAHSDDGGDGPIAEAQAVLDNTRPRIAHHEDVIVDATGDSTVVTYTAPTATDNQDPSVTVNCTPASGSTMSKGRHTVVCTAVDTAGNRASTRFRATVRDFDNIDIVIAYDTAPCGNDPECEVDPTSSAGAVVNYHVVSVTDPHHLYNIDNVSCLPASGSTFPNAQTTNIVCSMNVAHHLIFEDTPGSVTVTDADAPVIHLHGSSTVSLPLHGLYFEPGALVTDNVDASVDTTVDSVDGPLKVTISGTVDTNHRGTYTVHYNATDSSGIDAVEVFRTIYVAGGSTGTTGGGGSSGGSGGGGGGGGGGGSLPPIGQSFAPVTHTTPPTGGSTTPPPTGGSTNDAPACVPGAPAVLFTKAMRLGATGADVKRLQQFLNTHGSPIAATGPESAGNETTTFDKAMFAALVKYQEAHPKEILVAQGITKGTGIFGSFTMRFVNGVLKSEVKTCVAPLAPITTGSLAPLTPTTPTGPILFTRQLRLGSSGADVKRLQQFLNTHGFPVAASGPGSAGNETTSFTQAVKSALGCLQEANSDAILHVQGINAGTGIFGKFTLKFVNALLVAGK